MFRPADPAAVALAFWGPILAILAGAEGGADEEAARDALARHLEHFAATHVTDVPEER